MLVRYLVKRLILAVPVLFGISLIVFGALRLAPGDPALALAGLNADKEVLDAIRQEYGLDRSAPEQYVAYMSQVLRGNLGRSIATQTPVGQELASRFPMTFVIAVSATLLATIIGVTLGVIAAAFHRTWVDYSVMFVAMAWLSIPNYVAGLILIMVFAVGLGWLPSNGASSPLHFIMPVLTVAAGGSGSLARQTRSAVLEVLHEDYVRTARAKGLAERVVLVRHAVRNALIPVLTVIGAIFGALMAGAVIVETIFGIPGLGKLMIDRIGARDYPTVQGAVLLFASSYVVVNIVVDLAYAVADKRVHFE